MSVAGVDVTGCDREPIHIPGSIQPHGLLLVVDRESLVVTHAAGDVEGRLGVTDWRGRSVADLITDPLAGRLGRVANPAVNCGFVGHIRTAAGEVLDVSAACTDGRVLLELEPGQEASASASATLGALETAAQGFERATDLRSLCQRAAVEFRRLSGFDRVMVYRFLDGGAGAVLAEDRAGDMGSFLNHHFPGSDVPQQARALYVRNLVRVIPDAGYEPAPLRPAWTGPEPLDMSDCALRSVAPVHLQYLRNMGVAASASVSIVLDGELWGLIACHNATPRLLTYDVRVACRTLAGGLARQIKAKETAAAFRERLRMRGFEDDLEAALAATPCLDDALRQCLGGLQEMLGADGIAVARAGEVACAGVTPHEAELRGLVAWAAPQAVVQPLVSDRLSQLFAPALDYAGRASGLVAVTVSADEPFVMMWFRAEQVEVINWAGNPHKPASAEPDQPLTPRASFAAWSEAVRGQSRPWTPAQSEQAERIRRLLLDARQSRRLRELNLRLSETLSDKEGLLQQQAFLLKEVNHRVQNSLQLVSGFLGLQARASAQGEVRTNLEEAQRRVSAVALVHRRLYRADQMATVELSRYFEDLCREMLASMDAAWRSQLTLDIAPLSVTPDRAVTLGLVVTELVINANKYAYGGRPGPIAISLSAKGPDLRLTVADEGKGKAGDGAGFGSRMIAAMVAQLGGTLEYQDNDPGLRAVLVAPAGAPITDE